MKTPQDVINDIRNYMSSNIIFRFPHYEEPILNSLTELETILNPVEETIEEDIPQIPEPEFPQEDQIVLMKDENEIYEEYIVDETVVEEPVTETSPVKKPTVKKTAPKK